MKGNNRKNLKRDKYTPGSYVLQGREPEQPVEDRTKSTFPMITAFQGSHFTSDHEMICSDSSFPPTKIRARHDWCMPTTMEVSEYQGMQLLL
jgi:hypothetical protein